MSYLQQRLLRERDQLTQPLGDFAVFGLGCGRLEAQGEHVDGLRDAIMDFAGDTAAFLLRGQLFSFGLQPRVLIERSLELGALLG